MARLAAEAAIKMYQSNTRCRRTLPFMTIQLIVTSQLKLYWRVSRR
jgi:hypothetical protein